MLLSCREKRQRPTGLYVPNYHISQVLLCKIVDFFGKQLQKDSNVSAQHKWPKSQANSALSSTRKVFFGHLLAQLVWISVTLFGAFVLYPLKTSFDHIAVPRGQHPESALKHKEAKANGPGFTQGSPLNSGELLDICSFSAQLI